MWRLRARVQGRRERGSGVRLGWGGGGVGVGWGWGRRGEQDEKRVLNDLDQPGSDGKEAGRGR